MPEKDALTQTVAFRLTKKEHSALEGAAGSEAISAYLRKLVQRHLARRRTK